MNKLAIPLIACIALMLGCTPTSGPAPSTSTTTSTSSTTASTTTVTTSTTTTSTTTTTVPMTHGLPVDPSSLPAPALGSSQPIIQPAPYSKYASDIGAFRINCRVSHMNWDDPVVRPGVQNGSHLHTFSGNTGVNYMSTAESIKNTGNSTCTGGTANRTAYWVPTIVDTSNNKAVIPGPSNTSPANRVSADRDNAFQIYYKTGYDGVTSDSVVNFPVGLRMIAGTATATQPTYSTRPLEGSRNDVSWYSCRSEIGAGARVDSQVRFAACNPGEIFGQHVEFPQCWDGINLDSADHKSHMSYGGGWPSRGCPPSHPVPLTQVTYNVYYRVPSTGMASWRLSSDMYAGPPGYSGHGDWVNGWDPQVFQRVVNNCYQGSFDCQMNLLGDGFQLGGL